MRKIDALVQARGILASMDEEELRACLDSLVETVARWSDRRGKVDDPTGCLYEVLADLEDRDLDVTDILNRVAANAADWTCSECAAAIPGSGGEYAHDPACSAYGVDEDEDLDEEEED